MHFDLVYQGGLANVFRSDSRDAFTTGHRILQGTFHACEYFARGVVAAGATLDVWHINAAGDIARCRDDWQPGTGGPFSDEQRPPANGWAPVAGSAAGSGGAS